MLIIRPYQQGDKEEVRRVCLHAKPGEAVSLSPARAASLATFCDYYIECEPQNCFVAVDDDAAMDGGGVVGCIWCAENYRQYYRRFAREYLPGMRNIPLRDRMNYWGAAWTPRFLAKTYPAHLHIDVLQAYQRMGLGHRLMDALAAHLRTQGVPGVMLVVSAGNEKGMNFYRKYGFTQVLRVSRSVVMGLRLK